MESAISQYDADFVIVTETWLPPNTPFTIRGFEMITHAARKDTPNNKYGGCAIFVRKTIHLEVLQAREIIINDTCQVVQIQLRNLSVYGFYRSPSQKPEDFQEFVEFFESILDPNYLICGDLNCRYISWDSNSSKNHLEQRLLNHMSASNAHQYVQEPTHYLNGLLDVVISTPEIVDSTRVQKSPKISDHYSVIFNINTHCDYTEPHQYKIPSDVPRDVLNFNLSQYNWLELNYEDIEESTRIITERLRLHFEELIPTKTFFPDDANGFKPSTNKQIKLVKSLRSLNSDSLPNAEKKLDEMLNKEKERKDAAYLNFLKKSPKNIYKLFNKKQFQRKINSVRLQDGSISTDPEVIACKLNEYYASVFVNSKSVHIDWFSETGEIDNIDITESLVAETIKNAKMSNSLGPDFISNRMLKYALPSLVVPLTLLFRAVLRVGIIPHAWKVGIVRPIAKAGLDCSYPKNTRPICCASPMGKVLEKIIATTIMDNLEVRNWLCPFQYGYRRGKSSEMCIFDINEAINSDLIDGYSVILVTVDFSKCFDIIDFEVFLNSCRSAGITGNIGRYLEEWTKNHLQYCEIGDSTSPHVQVKSGLHQGSNLGPIGFLIVNNSSKSIFTDSRMSAYKYCDDCTIKFRYKSVDELSIFYEQMERFVQWSDSVKHRVNCLKTTTMCIGPLQPTLDLYMKEQKIEQVTAAKILGVTFTKEGFDSHRNTTVNRFRQAIHSAKIMLKTTDYATKLFVYNTYLTPIYSFCALSYFDQDSLNKLDDLFRSYFSLCSPSTKQKIAKSPSEKVLNASLNQVRLFFQNNSHLAGIDVNCLRQCATSPNCPSYINKIVLKIPANKFKYAARPLAARCYSVWNLLVENWRAEESDFSEFLSNHSALLGYYGPDYSALLSQGALICKQTKRLQIVREYHANKQSANSSQN